MARTNTLYLGPRMEPPMNSRLVDDASPPLHSTHTSMTYKHSHLLWDQVIIGTLLHWNTNSLDQPLMVIATVQTIMVLRAYKKEVQIHQDRCGSVFLWVLEH